MEGAELQKYVVHCLEWATLNGYQPLVEPKAFLPGAPRWIKLSTRETFTSNQIYKLYLKEVYKQSMNS